MSNAIIRNLKTLILLANTDQAHPVTVEILRDRLANENLDVSPRQLQRDLIALSGHFAITNEVGEHRKHFWYACRGLKDSKEMKFFRKQNAQNNHPISQSPSSTS